MTEPKERTTTMAVSAAGASAPELTGMAACLEDCRQAALDGNQGPAEPRDYAQLRGRLEAVREKLPPLYREAVGDPFIRRLERLGPYGFMQTLLMDPQRDGSAGLLLDIAQAILQQGENYQAIATDAFQEVIADLYDGFLSAEDRRGANPPDLGVIPPLVKWGQPDFGPYTWPADATSAFDLKAGIVSLPPANATRGLFAWGVLGHETAGHDILHADKGLVDELAGAIQHALEPLGYGLDEYWSERIDETASDVMGILNLGPAAGLGLVVYFRGLNAAYSGTPQLRSVGPSSDPHPADILRGYLAAETVNHLQFTGQAAWAKAIATETDKDLASINLAGIAVPSKVAIESAHTVARTLVTYKAAALEHHALGSIQNWRDGDQNRVNQVRKALRTAVELPSHIRRGLYAAHAVAAAIVEALADGAHLELIFKRLIAILKAMHDANPSWGPLFVRHPGNLVRHYCFAPQRVEEATEVQIVSPAAETHPLSVPISGRD